MLRFLIAEWRDRTHRTVPDAYFRGIRRLAPTAAERDAYKGRCFTCKHAVAFRSWWCERYGENLPCEWSPCYARDEITKADFMYGARRTMWVGLPDDPKLVGEKK